MWWRMPKSQYEQQKGERNKAALKEIIDSGTIPGIIAYLSDKPVGWCAVQPREAYPRMERSRVMKRIDYEPVWSVSCLFVARDFRRRGISSRLLSAAVDHARRNGAQIVEGYAVEPKKHKMPDVFASNGLASAYCAAGFVEVARGSETRPIMRYRVESSGAH